MGRQSRPKSKPMGAKLKLIRQHFGLSQTRMLAVVRPDFDPENRAVISQYEKGIADPDYKTLFNYAVFARISTDLLLDDRRPLTSQMLDAAHDGRVGAGSSNSKSKGKFDESLPAPAAADINALPLELSSALSTETVGESADGEAEAETQIEPDFADKIIDKVIQEVSQKVTQEVIQVITQKVVEEVSEKPIKKIVEEIITVGQPEAEVQSRIELKTSSAAAAKTAQTETDKLAAESIAAPPEKSGFEPKAAAADSRRRIERLLGAESNDLERVTINLPPGLLDLLDDVYLEMLKSAPRPVRPLLVRRHHYQAVITGALADYLENGEESRLSTEWRSRWRRTGEQIAAFND